MRKPGARQDADARLESLGECCPSLGALAGPLVDGHYPLVSAAATDGYDESMIEKTKHVARDIAVATNQWRATAPPNRPLPSAMWSQCAHPACGRLYPASRLRFVGMNTLVRSLWSRARPRSRADGSLPHVWRRLDNGHLPAWL